MVRVAEPPGYPVAVRNSSRDEAGLMPKKPAINPEWAAFQHEMWKYTVGLMVYQVDDDGQPLQDEDSWRGSGVLVSYNNQHLIATCAHTFSDAPVNRYYVCVVHKGAKANTLDHLIPHTAVVLEDFTETDPWTSQVKDLAFLRVDPSNFAERGHEFYPLETAPLNFGNGLLHAFGNPGAFHVDGQVESIPATLMICVPLSGQMKLGPNPTPSGELVRDIFGAEIEASEYWALGEVFPAPRSYGGMSGGGVWCRIDGKPILMGIFVTEVSTKFGPFEFEGVHIEHWMRFASRQLPEPEQLEQEG